MLRRTFLRAGSATGGALLLTGTGAVSAAAAQRGGGPSGGPDGGSGPGSLPVVDDPLYRRPVADAREIPRFVNPLPRPSRIDLLEDREYSMPLAVTTQDIIGGDLGLSTPLWGFGKDRPVSPGPTLVARRDRPVRLHWPNKLPFEHLLPVDTTTHWAYSAKGHSIGKRGIPTVVHLHGSHTGPVSDGHPDAWYAPGGATGPRFDGAHFRYENSQEAATLWYHDHAVGMTRLHVYAGLCGFYLLRDDHELSLIEDGKLPGGPYEQELVLQDRMVYPDGSLAYPDVPADDPAWPGGPSIQPEFFGQIMVVNGKAWPYMEVEPRQYRLRLLNGSNSRFYRLSAGGEWPFPIAQIGADGGFLHLRHYLNRPLLLSPGERADLIVDFRDCEGERFELTNDAPTPFPGGDPVTPPADAVLQFRVTRPYDRSVPEPRLPRALRDGPYEVAGASARTRRLLLCEAKDEYGRPKPLLGTVEKGGLAWSDPVTERPRLNSTEIWEIFNTTEECHPIHLHLVQFQVLDRAHFLADQDPDTGALTRIRTGHRHPPAPADKGPKDTVKIAPGSVTRLKVRFDKPGVFVWHCHLLEHSSHDMMRNFEVT